MVEGKQYISIIDIASYADDIRFMQSWSAPYHFININAPSTKYNELTQCAPPNFCIVRAIQNFTSILNNRTLTDINGAVVGQALAFTVHLLGDLHQPLHTGNINDLGGNKISITLSTDWKTSFKSTNLHSLVDTLIFQHWMNIEELQNDLIYSKFKSYIEEDKSLITKFLNKIPSIVEIAEESRSICESNLYESIKSYNLSNLPIDYFANTWPLAKIQILKGGVRLATVLNSNLDYEEYIGKNNSSFIVKEFYFYFLMVLIATLRLNFIVQAFNYI